VRRTGLRCSWVVEMVTDYLEAALTPALRTRLERHLATCEGCAAYLAQMRSTIHLSVLLRPP
jgi:anti-sigma factor RsiW